jgi:hypothetical protein
LVTVPIKHLFSYSGSFTDVPAGSITVYVHSGEEALEIALDEDSIKAVNMVKELLDTLLSKDLILTGTITRKIIPDYTQTVQVENKQVDVTPSQTELDQMQQDLVSKPLMQ